MSRRDGKRRRGPALFDVVIGLVAWGLGMAAALGGAFLVPLDPLAGGAMAGGLYALYLVVGYAVNPRAELLNLDPEPSRRSGWSHLSGQADLRFDLSILAYLLWPGALLARSVFDLCLWVVGGTDR